MRLYLALLNADSLGVWQGAPKETQSGDQKVLPVEMVPLWAMVTKFDTSWIRHRRGSRSFVLLNFWFVVQEKVKVENIPKVDNNPLWN